MTIENKFGQEQAAASEAYLAKLSPQDRANVERVMQILDLLTQGYDKHSVAGLGSSAIVGAYAIGGWVNKEGKRGDVDLLVVTNALWDQVGYIELHPLEEDYVYAAGDSFIESVAGHFRANGYEVEIPDTDEIPNEYSEGPEPRMMLRITPPLESGASPIDIVYVSAGYSEPGIADFEDFYKQDAEANGKSAGRVVLRESVITIPPPKYRL